MSESAVLSELHDHVLLVTINRPAALNAINRDVARELGWALERADRERDIRALVITGAGERAFCAGADLRAIARGEPLMDPDLEEWGFAGFVQHVISKPIVAAVNGLALGGGTEIVLAADLVVADERASFGLPEVKRGLMAAGGGAIRLPTRVPRSIAMEMILTGDSLSAADAARWGLVNYVAPDDQVVTAALELARRVSRNAPLAVQASKRIAAAFPSGSATEAELWRINYAELESLKRSVDAREGPAAFAEKREPTWRGR